MEIAPLNLRKSSFWTRTQNFFKFTVTTWVLLFTPKSNIVLGTSQVILIEDSNF